MLGRNFLDNILNSHIIKKFSGYSPVETPPKNLLEKVSDVIRHNWCDLERLPQRDIRRSAGLMRSIWDIFKSDI